jgi:putative hemolysin
MENGLLEVVIILVLILINGFFSMSEMAMASSRRARLSQKVEEGKKRYDAVLKAVDDPGPFLSTVQIAITLIGTIAGAFGGATLAGVIAEAVQDVPVIGPYSRTIGLGAVVLMITFLSVVLGELVPKRIALSRPEEIASATIGPLRVVQTIFLPVVKVLEGTTKLVLKLLGIKKAAGPLVTEDEVRIMIQEGTRHGVFEQSEQEMVEAVFYLGGRKAETFMTPRRDIVWIELDDTPEEIRQKIRDNPELYSFPVCEDGLDNIIGVVDVRDILSTFLDDSFKGIKYIMDEAVFIPESLAALKVLEAFKTRRTGVLFLVDEYGGVQGMVSVQDIVEEIIGGLPGGPEEEQEIVSRGDGTYLVDGGINIDEFNEFFGLEYPDNEEPDYHTLAGLILDHLGVIPATGDKVEHENLTLEIMDMDGIRIDKVLVTVNERPRTGSDRDRSGDAEQ